RRSGVGSRGASWRCQRPWPLELCERRFDSSKGFRGGQSGCLTALNKALISNNNVTDGSSDCFAVLRVLGALARKGAKYAKGREDRKPRAANMSSPASPNITSVLKETRRFPPPAEFAGEARIKSVAEYEKLWQRAKDDLEGFWAEQAESLHWFKRW